LAGVLDGNVWVISLLRTFGVNQINTYRDKSHYNKVHSPYLHRSKERSYDFNASGNSPLITVVINQSNIDNYGNVGTIQIRTTGNNKIFSEVTEKTYSNDITNWHLGRLSKAKVTHNAANTPSITRTSSFTYNSDGLLKSSVKIVGAFFASV
jgi:hypothetical protein